MPAFVQKYSDRPVVRAFAGIVVLLIVLWHSNTAIAQNVERPLQGEAYSAADEAYKAFGRGEYQRAVIKVREALTSRSDLLRLHLLLIDALIAAKEFSQAELAITKAFEIFASRIDRDTADAELHAQRGFLRNRQRNFRDALSDWETALKLGLPADKSRTVRLSIADAALSAKQPLRALRAVEKFPPDYEGAIRRAYALQALERKEEALAAFRLAARWSKTNNQRDDALRAQINVLAQLDHKLEARAVFDEAIALGQLRSVAEADLGYLAVQVGNDQSALANFDRAKAAGQLPPRAALDAGYVAKRMFENQKAIAYLKEGIDTQAEGRFAIDDQKLFDLRREVADLTREWGINSSMTYAKIGAAPNPFAFATPTGSYMTQLGAELYYRPEVFGYRNGALFEVFGRLFQTLYDGSGGPTGNPTTQGMLGARWKPLSEHNLVLEIDKLFQVGALARDDILLRAAYSYTSGTDLRVLESSWRTWQVYGEVDRFVEHTQLVALAEARFGQSFRADSISRNLVLFPHAMLAANYDDSLAIREAYSTGAGVSLRYWFGEAKYRAPPSYLEVTMQYRFRIAGDKRAEGVFAQASVSY